MFDLLILKLKKSDKLRADLPLNIKSLEYQTPVSIEYKSRITEARKKRADYCKIEDGVRLQYKDKSKAEYVAALKKLGEQKAIVDYEIELLLNKKDEVLNYTLNNEQGLF